MKQCEYCWRENALGVFQCVGCGAPFRPIGIQGDGSGAPSFVYDPRIFDLETINQFIARPGVSIPIHLAPRGFDHKITNAIQKLTT